MYKFSVTQWIFGKEEMETSFKRLKKFGYDGIELAGEPDSMDLDEIRRLMDQYELECTSICGIYTAERDLSNADPAARANAVRYVKACVDMAAELGAKVVIVVPSPVGKSGPLTDAQEEWDNAVKSFREAGEYAAAKHIYLAIEALNRFETYLVNKLELAKQLAEQVNLPSVGIMADLFHMNIEERNHSQAIRSIAPHLVHVHIADNTREAAGLGLTDFRAVMQTLMDIGYQGAITMEFLPHVSNPYAAAERTADADSVYDFFTKQSIDHMKAIMSSLSP
jgi:D-psicose/D-tagatose/L-ribulose 3-epimerase